MRFLPVVLLLAFALIFTVSVVDAQANSCGIGGRLGCIASCVAQNCATGSCNGNTCVCARCGTGPGK